MDDEFEQVVEPWPVGEANNELPKTSWIDWRHQLDGSEYELSYDTGLDCSDDLDLTVQDGRDDADINVLVRRFGVTGGFSAPASEPFYGDFSTVTTYEDAIAQMRIAQESFMELPSDARAYFLNDPGRLLNALNDPRQRGELERLKIVPPRPVSGPSEGTESAP